MGVSGSGKTTVGQTLAQKLGGKFFDGDDFHPIANVEKMKSGIPLNDVDRQPWLEAIHQHMIQIQKDGVTAVIACSALKQGYRQILIKEPMQSARIVYLEGSYELILKRLEERASHFFKASMLQTQFDTLEEPSSQEAIIVSIDQELDQLTETIMSHLKAADQG